MRKRLSHPGAYLITAVLSGLVLTGAAAVPAAADTLPPYYQLINHDGKCLDVPGGSGAGGLRMQQWSCNTNDWQYWDVHPSGFYGEGQLIENFYTKKCLSVDGDTQPGAPVVQENCTPDSASQNWYPEYTAAASGTSTGTSRHATYPVTTNAACTRPAAAPPTGRGSTCSTPTPPITSTASAGNWALRWVRRPPSRGPEDRPGRWPARAVRRLGAGRPGAGPADPFW